MTKEKLLYGEVKIRPILNFVALKYIAVIALTVSQIARCLQLLFLINDTSFFEIESAILDAILTFCVSLGKIAVPLMLAWMISYIFSFRERALKMMIFYGIVAGLYYGGEILFFLRYFIPHVNRLTEMAVGFTLDARLIKMVGGYFSNFNVFIDLFLCCAIYYFTMARPKRIRSKGGLIVFRACVVFPIGYIVASFVLSGLIKNGLISVNVYTGSLLPRRGLVNFFIFGAILIFLSVRERAYRRFNRSGIAYEEYEKTNRYCVNYTVVASLIFAVFAVADTLFGLIPGASAFGVGDSLSLMIAIPFLLMHDFTRKPKRKLWSAMLAPYYAISYFILFVLYINLFAAVLSMFMI
ncbi:MAG: hypothetical protein ACI4NG_03060 [Candidatus Gallimonas sp.]